MLTLDGVGAAYGTVPAVDGVTIAVGEGEAVGLLGANGAGKSTTLRAISGLVRLTAGRITFAGADIAALPPYRVAELGIAHVPEGRQVFPELTVQENLEIGAYVPRAKTERRRTLETVYSIFPVLAERRRQRAGTMSGGEQQMLAVGRGLMLKPRLLMLDEPSLGLAPVMCDVTFAKIQEIHRMGTAILLVEQNVSRALALVQRAYVLESGKVIMHGTSAELANNKQVQAAYLGIEAAGHAVGAQAEGVHCPGLAILNCRVPRRQPFDDRGQTNSRRLDPDGFRDEWSIVLRATHDLHDVGDAARSRIIGRPRRRSHLQANRCATRQARRIDLRSRQDGTCSSLDRADDPIRPRQQHRHTLSAKQLAARRCVLGRHGLGEKQRGPTRTVDHGSIGQEPFGFDAALICDFAGVTLDELPHDRFGGREAHTRARIHRHPRGSDVGQ